MKIIICGAGQVGQGIARRLAEDRHDVTVIDSDQRLINMIGNEVEVSTLVGHAAHPDVLQAAGAAHADMIVAVTFSDEINMVSCQIAHKLFKVQTKIARIRSQAYFRTGKSNLFGEHGIAVDLAISPERAVADSILERLAIPGTIFSAPFADGNLKCLGIEIRAETPLSRTTLSQLPDLFPGARFRVLGIVRNNHLFTAKPSDHLEVGDIAYIMIATEHTDRFREILNLPTDDEQKIVIIGAGNIGQHVALKLEQLKKKKVRLIEANLERAEAAATTLSRSIVINGDALAPTILEEAGVPKADVVVSLTNDDKVNLLSASMAKRLGAKKTITLINNQELGIIHRSLDIDVVVDPRAVTTSQILLKLRKGRILSLNSVAGGVGEIAEGEVLEHSPLVGKSISYSNLPEGIICAGLYRDGDVQFPDDNLKVRANDRIVFFYEREHSRTLEQLMRVSSAYFVN